MAVATQSVGCRNKCSARHGCHWATATADGGENVVIDVHRQGTAIHLMNFSLIFQANIFFSVSYPLVLSGGKLYPSAGCREEPGAAQSEC